MNLSRDAYNKPGKIPKIQSIVVVEDGTLETFQFLLVGSPWMVELTWFVGVFLSHKVANLDSSYLHCNQPKTQSGRWDD